MAWEAQQRSTTLFLVQAIDRTSGPTDLTREQSLKALQVVNMTRTQYLMGICPLYEGMAARVSCILDMPMLSRELPVIVRSIKLHPKEPVISNGSGRVVLQYQPLAVLVEIDGPEYRAIELPDGSAPKGHVWLRPVTCDQAWDLPVEGNQFMQVHRKQLPLAPRHVLTHYGLQGITARQAATPCPVKQLQGEVLPIWQPMPRPPTASDTLPPQNHHHPTTSHHVTNIQIRSQKQIMSQHIFWLNPTSVEGSKTFINDLRSSATGSQALPDRVSTPPAVARTRSSSFRISSKARLSHSLPCNSSKAKFFQFGSRCLVHLQHPTHCHHKTTIILQHCTM